MAEVKVKISSDNAILLLAAAEELGLEASVVRTSGEGHFLVPQEVADALSPAKNTKSSKKSAADSEE